MSEAGSPKKAAITLLWHTTGLLRGDPYPLPQLTGPFGAIDAICNRHCEKDGTLVPIKLQVPKSVHPALKG